MDVCSLFGQNQIKSKILIRSKRDRGNWVIKVYKSNALPGENKKVSSLVLSCKSGSGR